MTTPHSSRARVWPDAGDRWVVRDGNLGLIDEAWNDGKLAGIDAGFWRGFAVGVVLALLASFAVWRALS